MVCPFCLAETFATKNRFHNIGNPMDEIAVNTAKIHEKVANAKTCGRICQVDRSAFRNTEGRNHNS
jgi:hypothetical protein